tara:strand:- start:384 stop:806 length:423 start_codon:yes stop_codon:yes gene_type:complete
MGPDDLDKPSQTIDLSRLETVLNLANQNMSQLIQTVTRQIPIQDATTSRLSIAYSSAGGTTVKVSSGWLKVVSVNIPSTFASTGTIPVIYDANSPANVSSSNIMTIIPSSGILEITLPFATGLTVQPSSVSTHTVSVFYI